MNIKYLLLAAISAAVITIDQATKMAILAHMGLHEIYPIITNFFNITHVRNPGAAFGFLSESHPVFREIFFLSMPPVALLIILAILRNVPSTDRWTIASLSLVFGGAIGNYIDRLRFRYVIDFLDLTVIYGDPSHPSRFTYPSFNVADISIVCGVAILLFLEFTRQKRKADGTENAAKA